MPVDFMPALLMVKPATVKTLVKRVPTRYAIKTLMTLTESTTGSERFARETLLKLWGQHGQHTPEISLCKALSNAEQHLTLEKLLLTERHNLAQRLHESVQRLPDSPFNYAELYQDVKFFGPAVQRKWLLASLGENRYDQDA